MCIRDRYSGRADDVVGSAIGQARGNALNWRYTLALPVDGKVWEVQFDDWMYPVSYTHLRAHETVLDLVCRLLLEKKKQCKKTL